MKKFEGNQENPAEKNFFEFNLTNAKNKLTGARLPLKYSFTLQKEINQSVTWARTLEFSETTALKTRISIKTPNDKIKVNILSTISSPSLFSIPSWARLGFTVTFNGL